MEDVLRCRVKAMINAKQHLLKNSRLCSLKDEELEDHLEETMFAVAKSNHSLMFQGVL